MKKKTGYFFYSGYSLLICLQDVTKRRMSDFYLQSRSLFAYQEGGNTLCFLSASQSISLVIYLSIQSFIPRFESKIKVRTNPSLCLHPAFLFYFEIVLPIVSLFSVYQSIYLSIHLIFYFPFRMQKE